MSSTAWPLAGGEVIERDEEKLLIERAKRDGKALGELGDTTPPCADVVT